MLKPGVIKNKMKNSSSKSIVCTDDPLTGGASLKQHLL